MDRPHERPTYWQRTWENLQNRKLPPGLHASRFDKGIRWRAFVANLICWLAMLGVTAFVCERFTRRK